MQTFFWYDKSHTTCSDCRILRGSCELATRLPFTILVNVCPSASLCKTGLQTYFLMTILGASTTEDPKTAWDGTWKGAAAVVFTFFSRAHRLRGGEVFSTWAKEGSVADAKMECKPEMFKRGGADLRPPSGKTRPFHIPLWQFPKGHPSNPGFWVRHCSHLNSNK